MSRVTEQYKDNYAGQRTREAYEFYENGLDGKVIYSTTKLPSMKDFRHILNHKNLYLVVHFTEFGKVTYDTGIFVVTHCKDEEGYNRSTLTYELNLSNTNEDILAVMLMYISQEAFNSSI